MQGIIPATLWTPPPRPGPKPRPQTLTDALCVLPCSADQALQDIMHTHPDPRPYFLTLYPKSVPLLPLTGAHTRYLAELTQFCMAPCTLTQNLTPDPVP